ncbi:MAG: Gfo/Idh/MocA family oxidoreductase [Bryobacteraceae bacterium]
MQNNRREFLRNSAVLTALSSSRILGANDRVRVAGMGTGGRCQYLLGVAAKASADIVAVCDVYEPHRLAVKEKIAPNAQADYIDYRQVLDRKDIDAVFIGAPDHWHVRMTIDAVQAGKDVYVEKPISHSIQEGEQVEKAVLASKQVVQVGYQQRSWEHFQAAREWVTGGKLGKISLILVSWYQNYLGRFNPAPPVETDKLEWKRFLGSAPDQPFNPLRFTNWRWFWDFGGGHLTDLYSHYCDVVQWYTNQYSPRAAQAMGGNYAIPQFECPDTINASYDYAAGFNVVYDGSLVGSLEGGNITIHGSRALMRLSRDGVAIYPEGVVPAEKTLYPEPEIAMRSFHDGTVDHIQNFLDCVRSRRTPNADIKSAVAAARSAHLGNLAYRRGSKVEKA